MFEDGLLRDRVFVCVFIVCVCLCFVKYIVSGVHRLRRFRVLA